MKFSSMILPAAALTMLFAACQDEDFGFKTQDVKNAKYEQEFLKAFGEVDPNQDWSMATLVTANVNLPQIKGTAKMNICTGDPRLESTRLLAQVMLQDGQAQFKFDAIKGKETVFVTVEQNGEYKIFGQYSVVDGMLNVGKFEGMATDNLTRAFAEACPTIQENNENGFITREVTEIQVNDIENTITYSGKVWKLSKWVEDILANPGSYLGADWNSSPFTDASFSTYVIVTDIDWSKAVVISDPNIVEYDEETKKYTLYYGGKDVNPGWNATKTLDEWKADATASWNISNVPTGAYKGIWTSQSLIEAAITEPCAADDNGAIRVVNPNWQEWEVDTNKGTVSPAIIHPVLQYLDNVEKQPAPLWTADLGYSFFGTGSFFEESKAYYGSEKLGKFYTEEEMFQMEQGFSITTKGGPIELPYIFGCTAFTNQFGYVYWKVEDEQKPGFDPLKLKHFVLMEDARPSQNIYKEEFGGTKIGNQELGTWDGTLSGDWLDGSELQQKKYQDAASKAYIGTTYRVMYFGDDYSSVTGSYNWDEGYRIMFFIVSLANSEMPERIESRTGFIQRYFNYSIPGYNNRLLHTYQQAGKYPERKDMGLVKAIAWSRDGMTFLGFGDDSGDQDLNDIVFLVSGNFTHDIPPVKVAPIKWHMNLDGVHHDQDDDLYFQESLNVGGKYSKPNGTPVRADFEFVGWATTPYASENEVLTDDQLTDAEVADENGACYYAIWKSTVTPGPDPEAMSWIFACEDLGGTYDYDFNDVVWEVYKDEDVVVVRVLAAGGTLPFTLMYDGQEICNKTQAFTPSSNVKDNNVVNAGCTEGYGINGAKSMEFELEDVNGETWSIVDNYAKFSLVVKDHGNSTIITANSKNSTLKNKAPQIILVPSDWEWPTEGTPITEAYGTFNNWVASATWSDWCASKVDGTTVPKNESDNGTIIKP